MFSRSFLLALAASLVQITLAVPLTSSARQTTCTDVTVIHARGTMEPFPIGLGVGPPFRDALQAALGSKTLTFQGVDYPANILGFLGGGDSKGAATMTADIKAVASACPNTKIVMSGYRYGHFYLKVNNSTSYIDFLHYKVKEDNSSTFPPPNSPLLSNRASAPSSFSVTQITVNPSQEG